MTARTTSSRPMPNADSADIGLAAQTHLEAGRSAYGVALLKSALRTQSNHARLHMQLGMALRQCAPDEALMHLDWAAALQPGMQGLALGRALTLLEKRELSASHAAFEQALAASNDSPAVRWEFAMELLTEGVWGRGWDYYEERLHLFDSEVLRLCPLPWPQWQGQPLDGRTLLIHAEQGVGDEIMYASMVPDLQAMGARVVLACMPSLVAVMQHAFADALVLPHPRGSAQMKTWHKGQSGEHLPDWAATLAPHGITPDYQAPLGSLARQLRRNASQFVPEPYLRTEPARVQAMRHILEAAAPGNPAMRVGLAWCGNLDNPHGQAKSLPIEWLHQWATIPGVQWVSLQGRQYAHQAQQLPALRLVDMSAHTDDFADLAALASQLDLIISVDTSYAHLCGALGLPVWLPLRRNADWRWGWQRRDTVWYSQVELFRQTTDGDWAPVLTEIESRLRACVRARTPAPTSN